jgi:hypothetical protein
MNTNNLWTTEQVKQLLRMAFVVSRPWSESHKSWNECLKELNKRQKQLLKSVDEVIVKNKQS